MSSSAFKSTELASLLISTSMCCGWYLWVVCSLSQHLYILHKRRQSIFLATFYKEVQNECTSYSAVTWAVYEQVCCDYQTETCFKKIKMILILIVSSNKIHLLCLGAECIRMTLVVVQAAFRLTETFICSCSCIDLLMAFSLDSTKLSWLNVKLKMCCGNSLWSIAV